MIYRANNEPLVLTESDADSFLESVGVELYEDSIAIDGTLYEGTYGESILEANGIFLYEDGIVLEGKQAEEYKARKANEKADKSNKQLVRDIGRYAFSYPVGNRNRGNLINDDYKRGKAADKMVDAELDKRRSKVDDAYKRYGHYIKLTPNHAISRKAFDLIDKPERDLFNAEKGEDYAKDAANRHMRRHPKQYAKKSTNESTIFSSIEMI